MRSDWKRRLTTAFLAAVAGASIGSCKTPVEPIGPPVATNTITITNNTASPRNVEVAVGSRVLFINNDSRSHNMTSDPHPEHDECPDLNQVGFLQPGQKRETGNLVEARTCGFHDHDNPNVSALRGFITIR